MRWLCTHSEFQCIVLTQHHDYVQSMKPGRQESSSWCPCLWFGCKANSFWQTGRSRVRSQLKETGVSWRGRASQRDSHSSPNPEGIYGFLHLLTLPKTKTSRFCPRLLSAADQKTTTWRQNARIVTESICLCSEREGKRQALRLHLHQNRKKKKWVTTEVKPAERQINKNDIFYRINLLCCCWFTTSQVHLRRVSIRVFINVTVYW